MRGVIAESEAEFAIIEAWHAWHPPFDKRKMNGMFFFVHLQRHRPQLLAFDTRGTDPWQYVHSWLVHHRCVKD